MNLAQTNDHLRRFKDLLTSATQAIAKSYFMLPVANEEESEPLNEYRERVYAYELYHQLQNRWPGDWPYSLAGEVDKARHPIVRSAYLDRAKPDLLVHVPGRMDQNLIAIEIKPLQTGRSNGDLNKIQRDIRKLIAFRKPPVEYASALLLVFGTDIKRVKTYGNGLRNELAICDVMLFHHRAPGQGAVMVPWGNHNP